MKKLLLMLSLIATSAHAERWFEMPNKAGGKIILTEYKCTDRSKGHLAITNTDTGKSFNGCWYYFTDMVHIVWEDGTKSSFEPKYFEIREDK